MKIQILKLQQIQPSQPSLFSASTYFFNRFNRFNLQRCFSYNFVKTLIPISSSLSSSTISLKSSHPFVSLPPKKNQKTSGPHDHRFCTTPTWIFSTNKRPPLKSKALTKPRRSSFSRTAT